jgi:hypothetical protein
MANNLFFEEVPIVTRYFPEASSINLARSIKYGFGILGVLLRYSLHKSGLLHFKVFAPKLGSIPISSVTHQPTDLI